MSFPFDVCVSALRFIKSRKDDKHKKAKMSKLIDTWRETVGHDLYPLIRLILPDLDRDRGNYGVKEQKLADIYIKITGIDKSSTDAKSLIEFKKPPPGKTWYKDYIDTGKFVSRLENMLALRMPSVTPAKTLSIADVNHRLDLLVAASSTDEKEHVIRFFYNNCTLLEQIWLTKIILKDVDIGMTERSILPLCHPDAFEFYKVNTNLKALFNELPDPTVRKTLFSIKLFCPFGPMLSTRSDQEMLAIEKWRHARATAANPRPDYWIETKIDGERMQMHMEAGVFKWWTRNSTDYTHMYGRNSKEGSLVPFISGCFKAGVTSCILDGEMVAYNSETGQFEAFGSLKTASNETNEKSSSSMRHPCFVVFDLLLLNGKCIINQPLSKRYEWLKKMIVTDPQSPSSSRLKVLEHDVGKTVEDAMEALEVRISKLEEGIILKNPDSPYHPSGKTDDWIKLKPDYVDGMGDDLDLVMVGAYYGQGRRAGTFGSFLCAVLDDGDTPVRSYISFCKFGGGFSMDEYPAVSLEGQGNWKKFDPDNRPSWLVLPVKKDWPDMIIEPSKSHVVQVRGSQLIISKSFPTNVTIRFPRFARVRSDEKGIHEAMTKTELDDYFDRFKGKMQAETEDANRTRKAKRAKTSHNRSVIPSFVGVDHPENIDVERNIFRGLEFCVMLKSPLKSEIERDIIMNGGSIAQIPSPDGTKMIIANELTIKVKHQQGVLDIVKPSFIKDCVKARKMLKLSPKYMMRATIATEELFAETVDQFKDSYTEDVEIIELKMLMDSMPMPSVMSIPVWRPGNALDTRIELKKRMASLYSRYFQDQLPGHLFAGLVFYLFSEEGVVIEDDLIVRLSPTNTFVIRESSTTGALKGSGHRFLASEIRLGGGIVVNCLTSSTTHVVCNSFEGKTQISQLMAKYRGVGLHMSRMVSEKWVLNCIAEGTLLPEIRKKLVICGDGAVGKTALLMVQSGQPYPEEYVPTIFENYISRVSVGSKLVELSLWDTAGQEDYDRLRPLSYPDTDVILLAFSICNINSFDNIVEKWHPETRHFLPTTPRILVGCKSDTRNDPEVVERLKCENLQPVTLEEGLERKAMVGAVKYVECSAKTGEGVAELFTTAAKLALNPRKKLTQKCKLL